MSMKPLFLVALSVPVSPSSIYPEPFASLLFGRRRRRLGVPFGLNRIGVNLTAIDPGSQTSLHHRHSRHEEFVYVLEGELMLVTDRGEELLSRGMCAGFAPNGASHHLVNRSSVAALVLEIGERSEGDLVEYPHDDLSLVLRPDGTHVFTRKDGLPY
jgi:uncharacterized cupin superfamily protein